MIDLKKLKLLYNLSKNISFSDVAPILKSAKSKKLPAKAVVLKSGEFDDQVYYIRKGLIRQYSVLENGEERTTGIYYENQFFCSYQSLFLDKPTLDYYETYEPTVLAHVNFTQLNKFVSKNDDMLEGKFSMMLNTITKLAFEVRDFKLLSPEERYLKFLKENKGIIHRVPDKYIANLLGITPVSLSRIRSRIVTK